MALAILVVVAIGFAVAWSQGAFESRLAYWSARGQDCGSVTYGPNRRLTNESAAEQALDCFAAAYDHCAAAVLTRNVGGTDTGETDTFVVEPRETGAGCDVGLRYRFGIVASPRVTTKEVPCAGVTRAAGTLTISGCQEFGDITMP